MGLDINLGVLATQIINFGIIVYLLQRFLYKPVLSMLDKRRKEIEEGLKLKETMDEEREKLAERRKKIVKEANEEGQRIIAAAVNEAKKEGESIIEQARTEAAEEFNKRMLGVEKERAQMTEQARKQALSYAVLLAEKILGSKLTKAEQDRLLSESIERVQRV